MDIVTSRKGHATSSVNPAIPTTREVRLALAHAKSPVTVPDAPQAKASPPKLLSPSSAAVNANAGVNSSSVDKLKGLTVLVDMDNTLVDWDGEFITRFCASTGKKKEDITPLVRSRTYYEIEKNALGADADVILKVVKESGFYAALSPLPGALDAMRSMVAAGVDVRLVTSPHPECPASCAAEKYEWLLNHLGQSWVDRLIIPATNPCPR